MFSSVTSTIKIRKLVAAIFFILGLFGLDLPKQVSQMKVEASLRNMEFSISYFFVCGEPGLCSLHCLRFLYLCPLRHLLHHCFQALMDHGVKVASILANSFSRRCSYIAESDTHVKEKAIQFGFVLGPQLCFLFFKYY